MRQVRALVAGLNAFVAERIAGIGCMRALQRMGEDIADDELPRLTELEARMEREFAQLTAAEPALEPRHAAHG